MRTPESRQYLGIKEKTKTGTEKTKLKALLWQDKINQFVQDYVNKNPYSFSNGECKTFQELEYFVYTNLKNVTDPGLKNSSPPHKFSPPQTIKPKIKAALLKVFSEELFKRPAFLKGSVFGI